LDIECMLNEVGFELCRMEEHLPAQPLLASARQ
jgi:hypothetical protein